MVKYGCCTVCACVSCKYRGFFLLPSSLADFFICKWEYNWCVSTVVSQSQDAVSNISCAGRSEVRSNRGQFSPAVPLCRLHHLHLAPTVSPCLSGPSSTSHGALSAWAGSPGWVQVLESVQEGECDYCNWFIDIVLHSRECWKCNVAYSDFTN